MTMQEPPRLAARKIGAMGSVLDVAASAKPIGQQKNIFRKIEVA
jgi:hypothetical protein